MLTSKNASEFLGVHPNTLRSWADEGKIQYIRTPSGQRLYDVESFTKGCKSRRKIIYCRVSSKNQQNDLNSQIEFVRAKYPGHELITDIASGLNFKRKGFTSLLDAVLSGDVKEIVVAHKDRLCRFGFELVQFLADKKSCRIVVLDESKVSPNEELVRDLLSIVHVFSCKIYGLRKYHSKIKQDPDLSKSGIIDAT